MSDEMDVLFDHRLRSAFHAASLPPAPASLRAVLDDLPRAAAAPRRSVPSWAIMGSVAAGLAVVAFVAWGAIFGRGGFGPGGDATPTPTVTPAPSPSPTPGPSSSTYDAYLVGQLLERRADGTIEGDQVVVVGYFSDLRRSPVPCPSASGATLELGCFDRRQGIIDADALVGALVEDGFEATQAPVIHPFWPESLATSDSEAAALFDLTAATDAGSARPIFVTILGHFDDPLATDCPAEAEPPCADRFVVDDVLAFDDPATATPAPSATAFPFDSPPPPPHWIEGTACTGSRSGEAPEPGDPVDPGFTRAGWIPKSQIPYELPFGPETLPDVVYYVELAGDFPLGGWRTGDGTEAGSGAPDDFRWWGTATCIAYGDGVLTGWLPGSTYRLYRDGHRVDGGDPFDPLPTSTP